MHEFIEYFFGQGTEVEFSNFTLAHFMPILVTVGVILLIWFCRDKLKRSGISAIRWHLCSSFPKCPTIGGSLPCRNWIPIPSITCR